jgi:hypothetical protein
LTTGNTSCIVGAVTYKDMAKKLSAYVVSSCSLGVRLADAAGAPQGAQAHHQHAVNMITVAEVLLKEHIGMEFAAWIWDLCFVS